jgi:phage virion morphogenesis protein
VAGFTIKIDAARFDRRLKALEDGLANSRDLMAIWGEIALASISENFEQQGRPEKWKELSPVTIELRRGGGIGSRGVTKRKRAASGAGERILIGRTGNLRRIGYQAAGDHVTIGTHPAAKDYAAIQQFGGQAGRNRKVTIPARPYLLLQDEDIKEMREIALLWLKTRGK